MNKTKQKKFRKQLSLMCGIIVTVIALRTFIAPSQLLIVTFIGLFPVVLFALKFVLVGFARKKAYRYKNIIKKIEQQKLQQAENNQKIVWENETKKYYYYTRQIFHDMMQLRQLSRVQILEFNKLIDSYLGNYTEQYKHMQYENEAHEIYTKLHCYELTPFCYVQFIEFLEEIASNTNNANNSNHKGEDKNVFNLRSV